MVDTTSFPTLTEWVTASQAAEMLGISRQSVNRMIVDKEFATTHLLGERPIYVLRAEEVAQLEIKRADAKKAKAAPTHADT